MRQKLLLVAALSALARGQDVPKPAASLAGMEGKVQTADGQPLAQSNLLLLGLRCSPTDPPPPRPQAPYTALTDAEGRFSIHAVTPGDCYLLQVQHAGYPTVEYPRQDVASGLRQFYVLHAGQQLTGLVLTLARAILSGKVVDDDGKVMAGVFVRSVLHATLDAARGPVLMEAEGVETDADGNFKLTELPFGSYFLSFSVLPKGSVAGEPETDYFKTYYPGVRSWTEAKMIEASPGQTYNNLNVQLHKVPVFHVRGKVTNVPANVSLAAGEVRVFLAPPDGDLTSTQDNPGRKVAADGSFDYGGLPAGDWTLFVSAHDFILHQRPMPIADRSVDNLVLISETPATLTGSTKIVPELPGDFTVQQKPLGMPDWVRLVPRDPVSRPAGAHVYPDGAFSIIGVGASSYAIEVNTPSGAYPKSATFGGHEVLAAGLDFTQGTRSGPLQIVVSLLTGKVTGQVNNEDGTPSAGASVIVAPSPGFSGGRMHEVQADSSGQFVLRLAPGSYRLYALEGRRDVDSFLTPANDLSFLKPFESRGIAVTVAEGDQQQVTLTRIPGPK